MLDHQKGHDVTTNKERSVTVASDHQRACRLADGHVRLLLDVALTHQGHTTVLRLEGHDDG